MPDHKDPTWRRGGAGVEGGRATLQTALQKEKKTRVFMEKNVPSGILSIPCSTLSKMFNCEGEG